ncbi:hypothetical protein ACTFIU_000248 [Dictyostelium citrinum]
MIIPTIWVKFVQIQIHQLKAIQGIHVFHQVPFINSGTGVTKPSFYYKVTTSSTPYMPSNSYINSYMGEECSENYIVALQYYIKEFLNYYCNPITNYPVTIV